MFLSLQQNTVVVQFVSLGAQKHPLPKTLFSLLLAVNLFKVRRSSQSLSIVCMHVLYVLFVNWLTENAENDCLKLWQS